MGLECVCQQFRELVSFQANLFCTTLYVGLETLVLDGRRFSMHSKSGGLTLGMTIHES